MAGPRPPCRSVANGSMRDAQRQRQDAAGRSLFRTTGITFNVYGEADADEQLIPFDVVRGSSRRANSGACPR